MHPASIALLLKKKYHSAIFEKIKFKLHIVVPGKLKARPVQQPAIPALSTAMDSISLRMHTCIFIW
jgi:hypothetical protein